MSMRLPCFVVQHKLQLLAILVLLQQLSWPAGGSSVGGGGRLGKRLSHLCGSELVDMLKMVCASSGIFSPEGKRHSKPLTNEIKRKRSVEDLYADQFLLHDRWTPLPDLQQAEDDLELTLSLPPDIPDPFADTSGSVLDYENSYPEFLERSTISRRQRRSPGIVEECCNNPCSLQVLKLYCN